MSSSTKSIYQGQHEKNLCGPYYRMGFNCFKAIEPLRRDSLLLITKFSKIPANHLIYLARMKG